MEQHGHHHDDEHHGEHAHHGHGHTHGLVDPSIASTDRGLWALKWSFVGLMVTLTIFASALVAAYESITRLVHPQPAGLLWAVMAASVVGFVGNESVAIFRIRVGKQISSVALIA